MVPDERLNLFVKNILIFEEPDKQAVTTLPFFADGYPGLVFHVAENGLWVQPQNKEMPSAFLYGQTLHPVELHVKGSFRLIVFQLYPFVLHSFFQVDPVELNDGCYDMQQAEGWTAIELQLQMDSDTGKQLQLITGYLFQIFLFRKEKLDYLIQEAIALVLDRKGIISIKEICGSLHITPRTLERRFLKESGVSPKDFIQITKFQQSLEQLYAKDFNKLSDIVYTSGYADQSHFIRVFKAFTGKTPSSLLKNQSL